MAMFDEVKEQIDKYPGLVYIIDQLMPYKDKMEELYHYGMVLIGPDSFRQGEAINIVEYLQHQGFVLKAITTKRINRTETENLFLPTSTCMQCKCLKWWMIQDSSSAGEFAAAIFYSKTATKKVSCLKQLNLHKGKSDPLKNTNGVIRHDFKAINICLNLIHVPDTYGDFFKDTSPFYTIPSIFSIIAGSQKIELEQELFTVYLYDQAKSSYVFEKTIYKIKYLLTSGLFKNFKYIDGHSLLHLLQYYKSQYLFFEQEVSREKRHSVFIEGMKKELSQLFKIQDNIIMCATECQQKKALFAELVKAYNLWELLFMTTEPTYFIESADSYFTRLAVYNISIDTYEQLVVNTTYLQWK